MERRNQNSVKSALIFRPGRRTSDDENTFPVKEPGFFADFPQKLQFRRHELVGTLHLIEGAMLAIDSQDKEANERAVAASTTHARRSPKRC